MEFDVGGDVSVVALMLFFFVFVFRCLLRKLKVLERFVFVELVLKFKIKVKLYEGWYYFARGRNNTKEVKVFVKDLKKSMFAYLWL